MPFNSTIDHFMDILPVRALRHLRDAQHAFTQQELENAGVDDGTISELLAASGADIRAVVEKECRDTAKAIGVPPDAPNLFDQVDTYMRDGLNPLIDPVRWFLYTLLAQSDAAAPKDPQL